MQFTEDTWRMSDERFGMFVHFGLYSVLGGIWNYEKTDHLGEWIMHDKKIPLAKYAKLTEFFVPEEDWAEKLAASAEAAGIRYAVLTTKHHDGYCLFRSDYSVYDAWHCTGRDLVREYVDACRRHNLKVGFYYSHTLDWAERDAAGWRYASGLPANNDNYWDYPDRDSKDFTRYFYGKCIPQVKELLTNYGDVFLIWFDFPHNITAEQSKELYDVVKQTAPHCLVNSRIAHGLGDYNSLGDNMLPVVPLGLPTECLITLNSTWGYKSFDDNWKTPEETVGVLVRSIASEATLLMNVGPMGNGLLTKETNAILEGMGEWTGRNAEAIYGVRSTPFRHGFDWGYVSLSADGRKMYLYVTDPSVKTLEIPGVHGNVGGVSLLGGGNADYTYDGSTLRIPADLPADMTVPVYRVTFAEKPEYSKDFLQAGGVLSLNVFYGTKMTGGGETELVFEHNSYDPMNGKHGLAVGRDDTLTG